MINYGRPNHIYDADKIKGPMVVRKSKNKEKFIALGGEEYILPEGLLVIADSEKVLCVAGVIGGELSKVDENSKNILIEVANFNPEAIMHSGRILNIHTDSRFRFERRVDTANSELFMNYLTSLIMESCGGKVTPIQSVTGNKLNYKTSIKFSISSIKRITGIDIDKAQAQKILSDLGFKINGDEVVIPSYRQGDIEAEEDLVEEIIRIYGYENIPPLPISISPNNINIVNENVLDKCKSTLVARKLTELVSWSFYDEKAANLFSSDDHIKIQNPISTDLALMRKSILPNHLSIASQNIARGYNNLAFFEIGFVYAANYSNKQTSCIAGIRIGKQSFKSLFKDERVVDFYDAKADAYSIINTFNFDTSRVSLSTNTPSYYHPGRSTAIYIGKTLIAYCGEIHPEVAKAYDIKETVVAFEVFTDSIPQPKSTRKEALKSSNYQAVTRDFAFILDANQPTGEVIRVINNTYPTLIEEVNIFDIYTGNEIGNNKKSVAITVKLQPTDHTFSDQEIIDISAKIIAAVTEKFAATLRG
jgi:phenylalanyl-tRNA synthetase beta chain